MNVIQMVGMSPETLVELIVQRVNEQLEQFKKSYSPCTEKEILTPKEVCEMLGIDESTLWHWRQKGKIKAHGIMGKRFYKRSEIMDSMILLTPNRKPNLKSVA